VTAAQPAPAAAAAGVLHQLQPWVLMLQRPTQLQLLLRQQQRQLQQQLPHRLTPAAAPQQTAQQGQQLQQEMQAGTTTHEMDENAW
jgi:hypothetical protein